MTPLQATNIQVGDEVRLDKFGTYSDKDGKSINPGVFKVVSKGVIEEKNKGCWMNDKEVSIECVRSYPEDFSPVSKLKTGGFVGKPIDRRVFGESTNDLGEAIGMQHKVGGITSAQLVSEPVNIQVKLTCPDGVKRTTDELIKMINDNIRESVLEKKVKSPVNETAKGVEVPVAEGVLKNVPTAMVDPTNNLGVYRPKLEDRKVGKVRVELVDDGFPLALREVAKVMTWAQSAKGYKDHDWQNLPNAEVALAAATSRHRTDYIIQRRVDGLEAIGCVDHESEISHKAHEAFGVLAQLELLLRGKFE